MTASTEDVQIVVDAVQLAFPALRTSTGTLTLVLDFLASRPDLCYRLLGDVEAAKMILANEGLGEALCSVTEALGLLRGSSSTAAIERIREWSRQRDGS